MIKKLSFLSIILIGLFALSACTSSYNITFESNGGTEVGSITVKEGKSISVPNISREGHTLEGWYTSINGGVTLDERWSFTNNSVSNDITLYAKWNINSFTISFDTDGGNAIDSITQDFNTNITTPQNPTKEGYTFIGWDQEIPASMPANNVPLKAIWQINSYTLTYQDYDGSIIYQIVFDFNESLSEISIDEPERIGYRFINWNQEIPEFMPAMNLNLIAEWQKNITKLSVLSWGEYIDKELIELFEDMYNVDIEFTFYQSSEESVILMKSTSFDVVILENHAVEELVSENLLQTIDWSFFGNLNQVMSPNLISLLSQVEDFAVEDGKILDYGVPYFWGNIGIIYNKDVVTEQQVEAAGWDILADKDLRVMFYDSGRDAIMIALRALYGQTMNPNLATDVQLAEAEKWLKEATGPKTRYLTTEIYELFLSPALLDVARASSGEAIYILSYNNNLGYHVPTSGTEVWMDMLTIPKNSKQTDLAYLFIDFFMSYENALTNSITVGFTSPRADVTQEIVDQEIYGPEYQVQVRPYDQIHRYNPELKTKIEEFWTRIRAMS